MKRKPCRSGGKHECSNIQVSAQVKQLAMFGSNKIFRLRTEDSQERDEDSQYWLELDDIHELIRKLNEEDAG